MKKYIALLFSVVMLSACVDAEATKASATKQDQLLSNTQLEIYQKNQPTPVRDWSQLRQNLIEIELAQIETTATTSFMFTKATNGSTGSLAMSCPSVGFPIPATYSLTNPTQGIIIDGPLSGDAGPVTVDQLESNGVFTGNTTGTYVICVNAKGKGYAVYHEGDVTAIAGPATWDNNLGQIVLSGDPSAVFTAKK